MNCACKLLSIKTKQAPMSLTLKSKTRTFLYCWRLFFRFFLHLNISSLDISIVLHYFLFTIALWIYACRYLSFIYLSVYLRACSAAKSSLTLCDPMNCSPPGSSMYWILLERILKCVAISSSGGSSWSRGLNLVSFIGRQNPYCWAGMLSNVKIKTGCRRLRRWNFCKVFIAFVITFFV